MRDPSPCPRSRVRPLRPAYADNDDVVNVDVDTVREEIYESLEALSDEAIVRLARLLRGWFDQHTASLLLLGLCCAWF